MYSFSVYTGHILHTNASITITKSAIICPRGFEMSTEKAIISSFCSNPMIVNCIHTVLFPELSPVRCLLPGVEK